MFTLALSFFEIIKFYIFYLKNRSMSRITIFAMTPFDNKCQNLQMTPTHSCPSSYCFSDIIIIILTVESRSSTILALTTFDGKYQNLQKTFFALSLIVSEILILKNVDLQKVDQSYGAQISLLHHSMVNVKIYKRLPHMFALTFSEILTF